MDDRGNSDTPEAAWERFAESLRARDRALLVAVGSQLQTTTRIVHIAEREGCYGYGMNGLLSLPDAAGKRDMEVRDLYGVGPGLERFIVAAIAEGGAR